MFIADKEFSIIVTKEILPHYLQRALLPIYSIEGKEYTVQIKPSLLKKSLVNTIDNNEIIWFPIEVTKRVLASREFAHRLHPYSHTPLIYLRNLNALAIDGIIEIYPIPRMPNNSIAASRDSDNIIHSDIRGIKNQKILSTMRHNFDNVHSQYSTTASSVVINGYYHYFSYIGAVFIQVALSDLIFSTNVALPAVGTEATDMRQIVANILSGIKK